MPKMNFTDNQTAFEYALYEIAASYFDRAECLSTSKSQEKKLKVQFMEQKQQMQCRLEDICIKYMDELQEKLPKSFWGQKMKVRLVVSDGITEIRFFNKKCILRFMCLYDGRKPVIRHELWLKEKRTSCSGEAA